MNFNTFYNKILTDENMMETIRHSTSAYPFRFYYDNLALFDFHCIEWHWHVEFEFVYVEKGTAMFWVGEKQVTLETGQGLFVNSKILHRFYSKEGAVIPNFVFIATFIAPQICGTNRTFHAGRLDFFARNTVAGGRLTCHGKDCESTERGKGCRIENILFNSGTLVFDIFAC